MKWPQSSPFLLPPSRNEHDQSDRFTPPGSARSSARQGIAVWSWCFGGLDFGIRLRANCWASVSRLRLGGTSAMRESSSQVVQLLEKPGPLPAVAGCALEHESAPCSTFEVGCAEAARRHHLYLTYHNERSVPPGERLRNIAPAGLRRPNTRTRACCGMDTFRRQESTVVRFSPRRQTEPCC